MARLDGMRVGGAWEFPLTRVETIHRLIMSYNIELRLYSQCEGVLVDEINRLRAHIHPFEGTDSKQEALGTKSQTDAQGLETTEADEAKEPALDSTHEPTVSVPVDEQVKTQFVQQVPERRVSFARTLHAPELAHDPSAGSASEAIGLESAVHAQKRASEETQQAKSHGFADLLSALKEEGPQKHWQKGGKGEKSSGKGYRPRGKGKDDDRQHDQRPQTQGTSTSWTAAGGGQTWNPRGRAAQRHSANHGSANDWAASGRGFRAGRTGGKGTGGSGGIGGRGGTGDGVGKKGCGKRR